MMSSCLGLYIEENVIKYAKVSKEQDNFKVESFGVKFFDKVEECIGQIVEETFSYKLPIYVNLSKEQYEYFTMFGLLNKADLRKAIKTEFESYCYDKGFNMNALESRYALTNMLKEKDKLKTIYVYVNKVELNRIIQEFQDKKLEGIIPLPIGIANIADITEKENTLILNLEKETTLTTIINGSIYDIKKLETSIAEVVNEINTRENSYSKAYEILKNTTIYTSGNMELQESENEYLSDVVMNLYKILEEVKNALDGSEEHFSRMYITGTGALINNVDLYFQEQFQDTQCETLKPYFINDNIKLNMKDYIEVNSAIAVAMQGLGTGIKEMNFKKTPMLVKVGDAISASVQGIKMPKAIQDILSKFNKGKNGEAKTIKKPSKLTGMRFKLNEEKTNKILRALIVNLILFNVIYSVYSVNIKKQLNKKQFELAEKKKNIETQISKIEENTSELKRKTTEYIEQKEKLQKINEEYNEKMGRKNAISILLSEIMHSIPQEVVITSIENTSGRHVVINAEAERYEYLGYLKAKIKTDGILNPESVISTSGVKSNNIIKVTIEGDLP